MKPVVASLLVCLTAAALLPRASAADADKSALAKRARQVLELNCAGCHGPKSSGEGGLGFILDVKKLIEDESHYVVPGDPDKSEIIQKVVDGKMPVKKYKGKPVTQRPSAEDIALLKQWVEAGAPAFDGDTIAVKRDFLGPDYMVQQMKKDLDAMKRPIDRQHTRYFTLTHLFNANLSNEDLDLYRAGLSKLVNSLSRENPAVVPPKAIDAPNNTIYRIDLRDYDWNEDTWKTIESVYPYGFLPNDPAAQPICDATGCDLPYVRADWFVFTAARAPLYENLLGLPDTADKLEEQLGIRSADDVRRERVARAAFNKSGVSNNNRLLERHKFRNGAYWRSADFASNSAVNKKNPLSDPLNYVPDGGEIIFNLPNGLQAYMLVGADGQRIDKGPIAIVKNPNQRDPTVLNGISCMACHERGMIEKSDEVRQKVEANPNAFTDDERDTILALYPERDKFTALLQQDEKRFREAAESAGVSYSREEPVFAMSSGFEKELDLGDAAAELGVKEEQLRQLLKDSADLAKDFGSLSVKGGTVKRGEFEERFADFVRAAGVGTVIVPTGALLPPIASGPIEKLLKEAADLLDKGDKDGAFKDFSEAAAKDPKNPTALQGAGDLAFELEKYPEAIDAYNKAIELNPGDFLSIGNRGLAKLRQGDKDGALPDLNKAIDLSTINFEVYAARGDLRLDAKDLDGAIADYQAAADNGAPAVAINDKLAGALDERGVDFFDKEKYTDAIADFKKARDLTPKDADMAFHLGMAHKANGDSAEAIDAFKAAIALDENFVAPYVQKADVEVGLEKYSDAIDDLKKAVDLAPDNALLHAGLGRVYVLNGDDDQAIVEAGTAIEKDPELAIAYKVRAKAYLDRDKPGDQGRAERDLNKADELEKDK